MPRTGAPQRKSPTFRVLNRAAIPCRTRIASAGAGPIDGTRAATVACRMGFELRPRPTASRAATAPGHVHDGRAALSVSRTKKG